MKILTILLVMVTLISCHEKPTKKSKVAAEKEAVTQSWSYQDAQEYNSNQFDESTWDKEMLKRDVSYTDDDPWPTQPPITALPFPVAKYRKGYNGYTSKGIKLSIDNKQIIGGSYAVSTNEYSIEPKHNPEKSNIIFFNILVLTDKPDAENSANRVSSRNYPHHTCQGRRKTSFGNIDWFAMHLASGDKFAIVNTKYFNLAFGETILVAPQKDGSLRFKQMDLPVSSTAEIDDIMTKLENRNDVVEFFNQAANI